MRSDSSLKGDSDFMALNKTLRDFVIWSRFAFRCSAKVAMSLNSSVDGNSVEAVYATKSVPHLRSTQLSSGYREGYLPPPF